jgi:hypothetical protein
MAGREEIKSAQLFGSQGLYRQTSLREWAFARAYNTCDERAADLARMAAQL